MKTLYKIGMLAVAALAFAGCSKEVDNTADQKAGTHTLTFTVQKDVDTRTAVVEGEGVASYVWTEGDNQYFHIYENGVEATATTMVLSTDKKIATFTATFNNSGATEFTYTATYGSDLSNTGNPVIPSTQTPALNSFDPAADVLVSAEPITFEGSAQAAEDAEFQFKLKRVVSANKMTLKGLTVGERIYKVELTSDKFFSSRYTVKSGSYSGEAKTLVLDYEDTEAYAGVDGTFPVYFISAPIEDASFSVRVVTDGVIYTRDDFTSKLTLAVGTFRRFGINLSGYGQPIMSVTEYTKVDSDDQIADGGKYLIVAEDNSKAVGPYNDSGNTKYYDAEGVTIEGGKISIQTENASVFTLEAGEVAGQYYIKDQMGFYLTWNSGNSLERSDEKYLWTVKANEITSVETPARTLRYNSSSPRFACYTSGQKAITLYVDKTTIVELADPELSFEGDATINVNWADIAAFTAPALNNPHNVTVTYSSSDTDVATVDSATGDIEFVGDGTTVITATSAKTAEYKSGSAQYTLVVSGAPVEYDFTTVAELNALVTTTSSKYNGYLTGAVVSFVPATNTAIVKDATGSVMFFKSGHGLKEGQTYTGEIEVTAVKYNGLYSEATAWDATFTGEETTVDPEIVTLSDLIGHYDDYQNAYVVVRQLTVTSVDGTDNKNIHVTDNANNTYVVYYNPGNPKVGAGDNITVFGTITKYGETEEIKVWSATDLAINSFAPKAITFSQPSEAGCSITVLAGENAITSGTTVASGTTVTLSATVGTGYTFGGWTVTGATVANSSAITTTFEMGVSAVSVRATFTSSSGTTYTKVTSVPSDWSGTYILVYESSENSGLVCLAGTDAYQNFTAATISSGVITSNDLSDYEVEIAGYSTGYSVKALGGANAGKYLEGKGSSSNGTAFAASPSKVTTLDLSDGVVTITNNTNLFVYNSTSGANGERWRFYKSGTASGDAYKKPALYKKN